ncbi:MAG: beta-propeller domain-containing protein [Verrucomicrobiota bacterium]
MSIVRLVSSIGWRFWIASLFLLTTQAFAQSALSPSQARITSIRCEQDAITILVTVPLGVQKVTLESRTCLGPGAWAPLAVAWLDGQTTEVTFEVPNSENVGILRVRTDNDDPLPLTFYQGPTSFYSDVRAAGLEKASGSGANVGLAGGTVAALNQPNAIGRDVVESDLWEIQGSTLYFFNQYRGLQIIDLSTPDQPVVTGTHLVPAAGEQMYVLNGRYVILLAQPGCGWDLSTEQSQVIALEVASGVPAPVASLAVPGRIQESRLVGSALYVASQSYQPVPGSLDASWEWGTTVSSFDLSNPARPAVKDSLRYPGQGNVIYATDRYLFVVTQSVTNWWQSVVHYIDVSAADGSMKEVGAIVAAGRVVDKFKINLNGDVLTLISEAWKTTNSSVSTVLQTYSLAKPAAPETLGRLQLAEGEQLHATRFDGNRVYVVTFLKSGPLWIVDLANPRVPRITSELRVPGWSTHLWPVGNRLVSIGITDTNDWRVSVSLFDVQNPAKPQLLTKLPIGVDSSWSEANDDDRAFGIFPEAGLILVPYQGYTTNGYANRVQLIDLNTDNLRARGMIEHLFQPRRAAFYQDRIYSISGKELLVVNASDRNRPTVRNTVELSWNVDRVFLAGDYLLELANGDSWSGAAPQAASPPAVRVVRTADPGRTLSLLVVSNALPVAGATINDGTLYLAQVPMSDKPSTAALVLSAIDVSRLPQLQWLGQTQAVAAKLDTASILQPLWTKPGLLVWSAGTAATSGNVSEFSGGGNSGRFFAFDVTKPSAPRFVSEVNLTTNTWWNFSSAFTANGLVLLSHQTSEFVTGPSSNSQLPPSRVVGKDPEVLPTNKPPAGLWVDRYYLDVIDYADPKAPTRRRPVNIPGQLTGVSYNGAILYTVGPHWTNWTTDWAEWLDVSAYSGVSAALITSLALPPDWPHPLLVSGPNVLLGRPDAATSTSQIETWGISQVGKFTRIGSTKVASTVQGFALFGNLLAVQQSNGISLFNATNPAALVSIGRGESLGCLGYDLSQGAASFASGLWLPLADYGIYRIRAIP